MGNDSSEWLEDIALLRQKVIPLQILTCVTTICWWIYSRWTFSFFNKRDCSLKCPRVICHIAGVTGTRQNITVAIIFSRSNKNSPVQQQMLKMLPSWPNAFSIPVETVLLTLPSSSPEIVETLQHMLFHSSSRVWGFILYTLSSKKELHLSYKPAIFNNFVAPHTYIFKTSVFWTSYLKDSLGEISSLTPISPNYLSVSTVCSLSGFLSSNFPIIFSILTK